MSGAGHVENPVLLGREAFSVHRFLGGDVSAEKAGAGASKSTSGGGGGAAPPSLLKRPLSPGSCAASSSSSPFAARTSLSTESPCSSRWSSAADAHLGATEAVQQQRRLRLHAGAFQVPHPDKAAHGGEDAFFVSESGAAAGVADGVGEWGLRFGLDPRAFAEELMEGARRACDEAPGAADAGAAGAGEGAAERARGALRRGLGEASSFGASTALVVCLEESRSVLGVANLGDSGLRLLRRRPRRSLGALSAEMLCDAADDDDGASPTASSSGGRGDGGEAQSFEVVAQTEEQQHAFNQPFQLSRIPGPKDFPRLRAEGKGALVQALKRKGAPKLDMPEDAQLYELDVEEGDLVILGSDGLFDNLHDHEICRIAEEAMDQAPDGCADPEDLARALALAAARRGAGGDLEVAEGAELAPFGLRLLREAGAEGESAAAAAAAVASAGGGKLDDVTVVAAWIGA